jgi:hypothetical protein
MKKLSLAVMSILAILILSGCQQAPSSTTNPESPVLPDQEEENLSFIGSWTRVSLVVNGEQLEQTPTVLTLNNDHSYSSIGSCAASGKYDISTETDNMTMVISSTNCYGASAGMSATYKYTVSEDGKTMVTTTGNSVETFTKNS